ncbi:hypothetical protein AD006_32685 (plasmid) [Pseudonocardia sp. EC080610-09]|uniref:histone-like nucleoid-structuring protein Lsr2 n=1 Tax=Pseudonocardia sp. EC080610-09 TaxID=1688404 RepID=UPI000706EF58|nr:Lsr2 family protein [Pseudonocardia sp. EC080610-09]ALL79971.1 hypothetical protein AD006_32685 [Pseudonocardia sp. EC080610-09]
MAQIETVHFVDDLDGGTAEETVAFAVDGRWYAIDLSARNAGKLRAVLADYVAAARRASSPQSRGTGRNSRAGGTGALSTEQREHNNAIRQWARANGFSIADRGRISAEVIEAFNTRAGRGGAAPSPRSST